MFFFIKSWIDNGKEVQSTKLIRLPGTFLSNHIAFTVDQGQSTLLVVWDIEKSAPHQLVPVKGAVGQPAFHPDGTHLFVSISEGSSSDLLTINLDSKEIRQEKAEFFTLSTADGEHRFVSHATATRPYSMGGTVPTHIVVKEISHSDPAHAKTVIQGPDYVNSLSIKDGSLVVLAQTSGKLHQQYIVYDTKTGASKNVSTDFPVYSLQLTNSGAYCITYRPGSSPYDYGIYELEDWDTKPKLGKCLIPFARIESCSISQNGESAFIWGKERHKDALAFFQADLVTGKIKKLFDEKSYASVLTSN